MKVHNVTKRMLAILLLASLCCLCVGCAGGGAKKAWNAITDLGYTSNASKAAMGFYVKYNSKADLKEFPDEEIWNEIPVSGCCYLFMASSPCIAYADKSGKITYAYDSERIFKLTAQAEAYFAKIPALANAKDAAGAESAKYSGTSLMDQVSIELPYYEFIKAELIAAAMSADDILATNLEYKPLSEKELANLGA